MKKLLRKIIILIVIVCIFILIKKNTTRLGMSTQTGSIIPATGTVTTGIDLTNCVSYFDGCNHCSVKNGKPDACTLMYCEQPTQPKCLQYTKDSTAGTPPPFEAYNCEGKGGTLGIITATDGSQSRVCTLPNGEQCGEQAYRRGECGTTTNSGNENPSICTMEYAPVCAEVQVQCIKAPCPPIKETFGNKCQMNANKLAKFLYTGECAK